MSYDLWLLPAEHCADAASAREFTLIADETGAAATPTAMQLADDITAVNDGLADEDGFLSVMPLEGTGAVVFVPSPFPRVQRAREVVVPRAFSAGYGVYDPQLDLVLDPRTAVAGQTVVEGEGTFPTITPALVEHFAHAMAVEEFLIIETREQVYMQSKRGEDAYILEYRDGSPDRHFGTEVATADEVAEAMLGWIAGDPTAYQRHSWEKLDLG